MINFETLNKNTKKAEGFKENFRRNMHQDLFSVYGRPSYRKICIFDSLKKELEAEGFYNVTCVSGGTGYFTMACENATHIAYITYAHNYLIEK